MQFCVEYLHDVQVLKRIKMSKKAYYGAAFLMATSAIGPGFLTATALFTQQLSASFGFAILVSILVDLVAQVNVWRIITASGKPAQVLANELLPGLGHLLSAVIIAGGLVFNIGNLAGCGLGLNVLFGIDIITGAWISAALCLLLFVQKEAGTAMDWFAQILGFVMIGLMLYVAATAQPPLALALQKTLYPDSVDVRVIVAIVGGTVGGYITFAGAHRLLEAGVSGVTEVSTAGRSAVLAIVAASSMRILLFSAALGVVWQGVALDKTNPAASVFQLAAGDIGYKIFGVVIWAAAVTSVVGASFTSISFGQSLHPIFTQNKRSLVLAFIATALLLFTVLGNPVKVLVFAGSFNGFILAVALAIMLVIAQNKRTEEAPQHPAYLLWAGWAVAVLLFVFGGWTVLDALR